MADTESKRIYIGGLYHEATEKDVNQLFSKFGEVESVEIKKRTDNNATNFVFAYANVKASSPNITKCFKRLNGTFWKGKRLKLELAKEPFPSKLQKKREQNTQRQNGIAANRSTPPAPPKRKTMQDRIIDDVLSKKRKENGVAVLPAEQAVVDFTSPEDSAPSPKEPKQKPSKADVRKALPEETSSSLGKRYRKRSFSPVAEVAPTEEEPTPTRGALRMFGGIGACADETCVRSGMNTSSDASAGGASGARSPGAAGRGADSDLLSRLEAFSSVWGDDDDGPRESFVANRRPPDKARRSETQSSPSGGAVSSVRRPLAQSTPFVDEADKSKQTTRGSGRREVNGPSSGAVWTGDRDSEPRRRGDAATSARDDNQRRIESLKQKQEAFKSQKRALQLALSFKADAPRPNKRIVFDDPDEPADAADSAAPVVGAGNGPALFDDDDGDGDAPEADDFRIRPQYEGEKGQKLQALQARFGADERFVLDERFADEADKDEPDEAGDEAEDAGVRREHEQQMDILQSVLGTAVESHAKRKKKLKDVPADGPVRFDPSLEEHARYERSAERAGRRRLPGPPAEPPPQPPQPPPARPPPEVAGESFYQVAPALSSLFSGGGGGGRSAGAGFSLLQMMGRDPADDPDVGEDSEYKASKLKSKTKLSPLDGGASNPFQYDSSSSEDEADGGAAVAPPGGVAGGWSQTRKFFLQPDDGRLSEGAEFVRAAPEAEQLRQLAEERRPELLELFRTQRHSRARVLRKTRGRGRRPLGPAR